MTSGPLPRRYSERPRRVRGGKRLRSASDAVGATTLGRRFARLVEDASTAEVLREGLLYGRSGQVVNYTVHPGHVAGRVQGRAPRPYNVTLQVQTIDRAGWDRIVKMLAVEARHAASLLRGELSDDLLAHFEAMDLALLPPVPEAGPEESPSGIVRSATVSPLTATCDCETFAHGKVAFCKHAAALGLVIAERMDADALLAFALRGQPHEELLDRLRLQRDLHTGQGAVTALPAFDLPEAHEDPVPLEELRSRFWQAGPGLREVITSLEPPSVSHPLLRRLGPSPFSGSRFPMIGLLATCYDLISRNAQADQLLSAEDQPSDAIRQASEATVEAPDPLAGDAASHERTDNAAAVDDTAPDHRRNGVLLAAAVGTGASSTDDADAGQGDPPGTGDLTPTQSLAARIAGPAKARKAARRQSSPSGDDQAAEAVEQRSDRGSASGAGGGTGAPAAASGFRAKAKAKTRPRTPRNSDAP